MSKARTPGVTQLSPYCCFASTFSFQPVSLREQVAQASDRLLLSALGHKIELASQVAQARGSHPESPAASSSKLLAQTWLSVKDISEAQLSKTLLITT